MNPDPRTLFIRHFNGRPNPITPIIMNRGEAADGLYFELSRDYTSSLFGVTVIQYDPEHNKTSNRVDKSRAFESLQEARDYINQLR